MWSGPRNLSTAMMYSFGNRADVSAIDEPFYGAYLKASGADHPMRAETLSEMETDAGKVAQNLKRYSAPYPVSYTHLRAPRDLSTSRMPSSA